MQPSRWIRYSALVIAVATLFAAVRDLETHSETRQFVASPGQTFMVTTTAGSGAGSLRQAILDANSNAGLDTIAFNIPGGGLQSIINSTAFANITDPVVIDATTQPGYAGVPLIELDGSSSSTTAFNIVAGGSTIRGLRFANYGGASTNFVVVLGGGNNAVTSCTFGVGDTIRTSTAILIDASNNNRIGGSTVAERNYIAQNRRVLIRNGASGNRVVGNWFGADTNGAPLARTIGYGVRIENASGNFVGGSAGTTPGGGCTGECNSIAGTNNGVEISGASATNNKVSGNMIGLLADGMTVNANATYGVRITDAPGNLVGGMTAAERNVLTGSPQGGVRIENALASGNVVSGNYIGVKTDGVTTGTSTSVTTGVSIINGVTNTRIGGVTTGERNIISGNNSAGISISTASNNNVIQGNYIGTDASGTQRSTTRGSGISITNSNGTIIGGTQGTTNGGACTGACNVISGNGVDGSSSGIFLFAFGGSTASGNMIDGNYIGLNAAGNAVILNGKTPDGLLFNGRAIQLVNASTNVIGRPASLGQHITDRSLEEVPATTVARCVQDEETGDYVSWLSPNGRDEDGTDFVQYEAKECSSGITYTGSGELTLYPTQNLTEGLSVDLETAYQIYGFYTTAPAVSSIGKIYTSEVTSNIEDKNPANSSCQCPTIGAQTIAGTVEATGQGGDSNANYIGYQHFGQTAQGFPFPTLNLPESPILINFGNGNRIELVAIYSPDQPPIEIRNGVDNDFWQIDVQRLQDDLSVEIGAGAEQVPRPANINIFTTPSGTLEITGLLNGALPNTNYRVEAYSVNIFDPEPPGAISYREFDGPTSIRFDLTTNGSGNGSFDVLLNLTESEFLKVQNGARFSATELFSSSRFDATLPEVITFGASSRMSDYVTVPGATVSGRVRTPFGTGLRNVEVTLLDTITGYRRTARTSTFGFYAFTDVTIHHRYAIDATSRRFRFSTRNEVITTDLTDLDFTGME